MNIKANNPDLNEQENEFFDAYIEGGSPLSEIYNNIDSAEPSDKLNQMILSAAAASTKQSIDSKKWWTQAGSWAASVAIISLVGILAHNTWQAEQDAVHKEMQGEIPTENLDSFSQQQSQQSSLAKQKSISRPDRARMESDTQIEQATQAHNRANSRAKKSLSRDNSKDSRKLLYKAAPAPVMPSAPSYFEANKTADLLKESQIQEFEDIREERLRSPEVAAKIIKKERFTEQQIMLNKISQLIENNEIDQAQELLLQFKTKYPDYPIAPVILEHLSPY